MEVNKRISIIIITSVTIMVLMIVGVWVYNYYKWKPVLERQSTFIEDWGSYDYNNFSKYPERLRPYLSDQVYADYFGDKESLAIREGKLIAKNYTIRTTVEKTVKKTWTGNTVSITTKAREEVSSLEENTNKEKEIIVTWDYSNEESPKVINIEYK